MDLRPLLVVEHEADAGPGRLGAALESLGVPLDVCRPYAGDRVPADASGHSGVVVLGGEMCAWDDEKAAWLPATRDLLAGAVAAQVPVLGVCLGAQLLAMACGGRVAPGAAGLEVGLAEARAVPGAERDAVLGSVLSRIGRRPGDGFAVTHYHRDAVHELPPDAVLLATGDTYPVQAFRVGPAAWGVQYHPEVTEADFTAWTRIGHDSLRAAGFDPDALAAAVRAESAHLEALATAHAAAFAEVVRG